MAKPQIGLPVFLTHMSRRGILACVLTGIISLAILPRWPLLWIGQMGNYEHFFPLLVLPGPLIALALTRYRDRDAWLLVFSAVCPQRWFFDSFILWLIPKSHREIAIVNFFSWGVGVWRWWHMPRTVHDVGLWTVLGFYLPMLSVILMRWRRDQSELAIL